MHKVGQSAHTAHGIGEIVEVDPGVRGSVSYKVAGRGFAVWVDAAKLHVASSQYAGLEDTIDPGRPYEVNKDNSTTLPYDYTPQHHVDMFAGEQTIQPGDYEIDPDERLHASDSLTGEQRKDNRPYPGPNPDLFAKSARSEYDGPGPEDEPYYEQHSADLSHEREQDEHAAQGGGWPHHGAFEDTDSERPEQGDDEWHEGLHDGPERTFDASYRPAGLSNRYAHIMEAQDHTEIGMFRRDPVGYQQRLAHVMIAGEEDSLIEKFADYTNLLDADEHMRTAAWKDVAAKAKRLRADGAVHPKDIGPNRIMAMVDGDNAQYQTLVLRGADYAGIGKGANSATFSCTCSWGKWAFKRQFTFVGRMCSHALATLWELQSHTSKGNKGKFKSAAIGEEFKKWADDNNDGHIDQGAIQDFLNTKDEDFTREDVDKLYDYVSSHHQQAPERDYDIPYTLDNEKAYKTSEILRTRPQSLTPDLREVPKNDEHEWTDVTEDDRKTTAPDQIVRFQASLTASLHHTAAGGQWMHEDESGGDDHGPSLSDMGKALWRLHTGDDPDQPPTPAASDYHMDMNDTPAGGLGKGAPAAPLSISDYLHPQGPANAAGDAHPVAPVPGTMPGADGGAGGAGNPAPGGPSAPGNPAPTPAPSAPAPTPAAPGAPGPNAIGQGSTYHVNQGDTLSDIAQRAGLGKDNYQQIADANKDKISDPNHIETGWDLKIPGQSSPSSSPGPHEMGSAAPDASTPGPHEMGSATPPVAPAPPPAGQPPAAAPPPSNSLAINNPGLTPPGQTGFKDTPDKISSRRRYAESSDASLLDKLRQKSVEPASDDLQHMDSRNDEIRDLVDELNDRGMDASFMVANLHYADHPDDGNPDFLGISSPGWADQPFAGSGPDPRHYISDSQSYLDDHEPDLHDVTDGEDIIKFNDDRSKPQQGPRHTSGIKPRGGPRNTPRIDPGVRGHRSQLKHSMGAMPEEEGPNTLGGMEEADPMAPSTNDNPGNDLVASFQRSAAAADLMSGGSSGGGGGGFSDDAIAANAQAMLRTAGRKFTQQEQRDLEEEAHILGARNMPNEDDLAGTHYLMGI